MQLNDRTPVSWEVLIAGLSLLMLLAAQVLLCSTIHGTNYLGADGKQTQATVIAALNFSGWFHVTNISPIEGVGSQLLPLNVWANPSFWPFAFLDKELATDVSAAIALGVFVTAGYLMARCFNIPPLPSAIAAQLCIVLHASGGFRLYSASLPAMLSSMLHTWSRSACWAGSNGDLGASLASPRPPFCYCCCTASLAVRCGAWSPK
jgi:hypothetical protein